MNGRLLGPTDNPDGFRVAGDYTQLPIVPDMMDAAHKVIFEKWMGVYANRSEGGTECMRRGKVYEFDWEVRMRPHTALLADAVMLSQMAQQGVPGWVLSTQQVVNSNRT